MLKGLLVEGEEIISAFSTVRDKLVFTTKRIISIDVQGITGKKKSFASLPYRQIQYFTIQTTGFLEVFPDSELYLYFANGSVVTMEFKDSVNITSIGQIISHYVLG